MYGIGKTCPFGRWLCFKWQRLVQGRILKDLNTNVDVLELISLCWQAAEEIERLDDMLIESLGHTDTLEGSHADLKLLYALRFSNMVPRMNYIDRFPEIIKAYKALREVERIS